MHLKHSSFRSLRTASLNISHTAGTSALLGHFISSVRFTCIFAVAVLTATGSKTGLRREYSRRRHSTPIHGRRLCRCTRPSTRPGVQFQISYVRTGLGAALAPPSGKERSLHGQVHASPMLRTVSETAADLQRGRLPSVHRATRATLEFNSRYRRFVSSV
jgi:hypothetical protein